MSGSAKRHYDRTIRPPPSASTRPRPRSPQATAAPRRRRESGCSDRAVGRPRPRRWACVSKRGAHNN
jgi:hypothetical protein